MPQLRRTAAIVLARFTRFVRVPAPSMIVAVAALLVATSGAALAAIPDADDVIHGCINNRTGVLRIIDSEAPANQSCTNKESPLTWNQTGPQGVPGADGESIGFLYSNIVTGTGSATAFCDAGDTAISGGADTNPNAPLTANRPYTGVPHNAVMGWIAETDDLSVELRVYVACLDKSP